MAGLRQQAEQEAEVGCLEIETSLGLALADVCEAMYLGPTQMRWVMGDAAYNAIYHPPIPVMFSQPIASEETVVQE